MLNKNKKAAMSFLMRVLLIAALFALLLAAVIFALKNLMH